MQIGLGLSPIEGPLVDTSWLLEVVLSHRGARNNLW